MTGNQSTHTNREIAHNRQRDHQNRQTLAGSALRIDTVASLHYLLAVGHFLMLEKLVSHSLRLAGDVGTSRAA